MNLKTVKQMKTLNHTRLWILNFQTLVTQSLAGQFKWPPRPLT